MFTTLLHEATHGLATARNIHDTSRQGRWHNKHFATLAAELGMSTDKDDKLGYSPCTLTDPTAAHYRPVIDRLATALGAFRHPDPAGTGKGRTNNNNGVTAECECPRKIRIARSALDDGPIACCACGSAFLPDDILRDDTHRHLTGPAIGQHADHTGKPGLSSEEDDDPMVFYDPTGQRFGLPTYPYKFAPAGLATLRQLRRQGLRPGGQTIAAQILWRRGKRKAYLYRLDQAKPKRTATPAQLAAIGRALTARRTCPTCGLVKDYYIPRRHGECLDCTPGGHP